MVPTGFLPDENEKDVVILMTSGPSTPLRCATPFFIGALLASMDAQVRIFLTMEGVKLGEVGVAEGLTAIEGGKRIIDFIRDAKNAGCSLYMCLPALPGFNIDESKGIIPEVDELSSGGALADMLLSADKVISF